MKTLERRKLIVALVVIIAVVLDCAFIYKGYKIDKEEYTKYHDEYTSLYDTLLNDITTIVGLQDKETEYEDKLYQEMTKYYKNSDDEVIKYVFDKRFPSPINYENDRKSAFVIIYALLEVYPEIKQNKDINESIAGINNTLNKLKETIEAHNAKVDHCNELIAKINDTNYVHQWKKDATIDTEIRKVLFLEEQ